MIKTPKKMENKNLEMFRTLAQQEVERNNILFEDKPEYELAMEDEADIIRIHQVNDEQACCFDQLIKLADACRLTWYINVIGIRDGMLTPQLCVF